MIDIEKIAINYLLYNPDSIDDFIQKGITEDFFLNTINSLIYKIMLKYKHTYKKSISRIELEQNLIELNITKEIYEQHLNVDVNSLIDIHSNWLISELFEHKRKSIISDKINKIIQNLNSNNLQLAEKEIINTSKILSRLKPNTDNLVHFNTDNLQLSNIHIPVKKVFTGFQEIDDVVKGFNAGELIVVAARPKVGKTRMLINLIANMLKQKLNILAFTLEVPKDQYKYLMYSCLTKIPFFKFKNNLINEKDYQQILKVKDIVEKEYGQLVIYDTLKGVNPDFIRSKIEELEEQFNIQFDVITIDHATMMKPNKSLNDDWLNQGSIAEDLRAIGREMNKVMITALQIRRTTGLSEKSKSKLDPGDELARSDIWFQTLDVLLALSKSLNDSDNSLSILTVKIQQRHGESAIIELMKDFSITSLYSINDPSYRSTLDALSLIQDE